MISKKTNQEVACQMCGSCCRMEIPLSLLDIHRMEKLKGAPASTIFHDIVQGEISKRSSLYMIRKDERGFCLFLTDEKRCSIHAAKPNACQFYSCGLQSCRDVMPWTATCTDPAQRAILWEQSVAAIVTKAYIEKNGSRWNEEDYRMAMKGILENIQVRDTQTLKLARNMDGAPMALLYDCSECGKKGLCTKETPVTLDDIRRISTFLGITWKEFFKAYLSSDASVVSGGLKLKRRGHCVFFHPEKQCGIEEAKPIHCRFTPCPLRAETDEMMDAFYLGSGTIEEQFRHQVAMAVTREYVSANGTAFKSSCVNSMLKRMEKILDQSSGLKEFCSQIARFRYVDDILPMLDIYHHFDK